MNKFEIMEMLHLPTDRVVYCVMDNDGDKYIGYGIYSTKAEAKKRMLELKHEAK